LADIHRPELEEESAQDLMFTLWRPSSADEQKDRNGRHRRHPHAYGHGHAASDRRHTSGRPLPLVKSSGPDTVAGNRQPRRSHSSSELRRPSHSSSMSNNNNNGERTRLDHHSNLLPGTTGPVSLSSAVPQALAIALQPSKPEMDRRAAEAEALMQAKLSRLRAKEARDEQRKHVSKLQAQIWRREKTERFCMTFSSQLITPSFIDHALLTIVALLYDV
jgi:hypothetical protein